LDVGRPACRGVFALVWCITACAAGGAGEGSGAATIGTGPGDDAGELDDAGDPDDAGDGVGDDDTSAGDGNDDDGGTPVDCPAGTVPVDDSTLFVSAPLGLSDAFLGRPVDGDFEFIGGEAGASLFPGGEVSTDPSSTVQHRYHFVEDSRDFKASAGGWGVSASLETASSRRYASFSSEQLVEVHQIDDTADMEPPPAGAAFFLWRIYYGHNYEVMVQGESERFHAGVRASFLGASGSIETFAESNELEVSFFARGLTPVDGQAIFAKTEEEIEAAYAADGPPVPIYVEYRTIPSACAADPEQYEWLEPLEIHVAFDSIHVYNDGSLGADTWSLVASCRIGEADVFLEDPFVWTQKPNVSDDCMGGDPGPGGDGNYCPYELGWSSALFVQPGDVVRCGIEGTAHDDGDTVEYAEFEYLVADPPQPQADRIGAANGATEYWAFYSVGP
jgi:hypothetical protein